MDILIGLDKNYLAPTEIMLHSLFKHNKDMSITVHAMVSGDDDYVNDLKAFVEEQGKRIITYDMKKFPLPVIPSHSNDKTNYPLEAYYRLFAAEILPKDMQKILWLDGDIIVYDDLSELWNTDISDYAVGAVPGYFNNNSEMIRKLGYDPKYGYFNSGVLLINLDYWRNNHVVDLFVDYIKNNMDILTYADQDVLNPVFCDKKRNLPIRYNFCTNFLFNDIYRTTMSESLIEEVDHWYKNPCIIHFHSKNKPWKSDCDNIYRWIWRKYRDETKWKGYLVKKNLSLKERIARVLIFLKHGEFYPISQLYNKKYQLKKS